VLRPRWEGVGNKVKKIREEVERIL
jgi:hypothetical protein